MIVYWILFVTIPCFCFSETLSFYKGYLMYREHLKNLNFDEVVEGMKAARQGKQLSEKEIRDRQQELYLKAKEENLAETNRFLSRMATQKDVNEIIKDKLYYKLLHGGSGSCVQEMDTPLILYKMQSLVKGKEPETFEINEPQAIFLRSTIPGFLKGVVGMQEGERRVLYIHPDVAYGDASSKVEPNSLLIIEVEIVKI